MIVTNRGVENAIIMIVINKIFFLSHVQVIVYQEITCKQQDKLH